MARKTLAALSTPVPVRSGHYADYPACLPQYKWLVELALKSRPDQMFNLPTSAGPAYCKCCGAAYAKKDWEAHVNEHAQQLKLRATAMPTHTDSELLSASAMNTVLDDTPSLPEDANEILLTILDSLKEKLPDLELDWTDDEGTIADALVFDLVLETEEMEIGTAPFCADCERG